LGYRFGVPQGGYWREMLNTDAGIYGGSNLGNSGGVMAEEIECDGFSASVLLTVPPLATVIFKAE
jgi:1,4-alpha-glucan branching enzyme